MNWFKEWYYFQIMQGPGWMKWNEIWTYPAPDGFHKYRFFIIMDKIHKKCKWCSIFNKNNWTRSTSWLIIIALLMSCLFTSIFIYTALIGNHYTIEYIPITRDIKKFDFSSWNLFYSFSYDENSFHLHKDFNRPIVWIIFVFSCLISFFYIDSLWFQISTSRNKFLKQQLKEIYSIKCNQIAATKPIINVSNPWKSMSPYVLILCIVSLLGLSIGDIVISSQPPVLSISEIDGLKYISFSSLKYSITDVSWEYFGFDDSYLTFIDFGWSTLYKAMFWIPFAITILAVYIPIYWGNRTTTIEIAHVVYLKLKDPEYQKSINLTKDEIKFIKETMNNNIEELIQAYPSATGLRRFK